MITRSLALLCLLVAMQVQPGAAQTTPGAKANEWSGTWSARSNAGRALMGTWTAVADTTNGTVTGTWALVDANGTTLASGGWAAAKTPTEWTGGWRAVVYGSNVEYTGTWSASVGLKLRTPFAALFESAVKSAVSGNWRLETQSGAWSIQAFR